jgi:hypothetical protein
VSDLPDDGLTKKAETCSSLEIKINNEKRVALDGYYNTLVDSRTQDATGTHKTFLL